MRIEGSVVLVDLVEEQSRIVLARYHDVELQSAGLVLQATGPCAISKGRT